MLQLVLVAFFMAQYLVYVQALAVGLNLLTKQPTQASVSKGMGKVWGNGRTRSSDRASVPVLHRKLTGTGRVSR